MKDPLRIVVGPKNSAAKNVEQKLVYTGNENGKMVALKEHLRLGMKPPVLIFVNSREKAKQLIFDLMYEKVRIDMISGDRSPEERSKIIEKFRSGKIWILIATDLLARGIDFDGYYNNNY